MHLRELAWDGFRNLEVRRLALSPGFNVFVVKDGRLTTPDRGSLGGITRMIGTAPQYRRTAFRRNNTIDSIKNTTIIEITKR